MILCQNLSILEPCFQFLFCSLWHVSSMGNLGISNKMKIFFLTLVKYSLNFLKKLKLILLDSRALSSQSVIFFQQNRYSSTAEHREAIFMQNRSTFFTVWLLPSSPFSALIMGNVILCQYHNFPFFRRLKNPTKNEMAHCGYNFLSL